VISLRDLVLILLAVILIVILVSFI